MSASDSNPTDRTNCPVCRQASVEMFFEMKNVPVHCNVPHATRDGALSVQRGDMQLGFCRGCGHIYNYAFDPSLTTYTQAYENSLHFSPRFQQYAEGLATDLINRYDLHGKTIIEIGCGKGNFLKLMCERGGNRGIGFDESYEPDLAETKNNRGFTVIRDFYSEKHSHYKPDFIYCRHVLEHIKSPAEFVADVRNSIAPECAAYFEVPNALNTLNDLAIWDLIYEHCSYFTAQSLSHLFTACGFGVTRLEEKYDGQFLGIELNLNASPVERSRQSRDSLARTERDRSPAQLVQSFGKNYRTKVETWKNTFEQLRREGERVVVWGSGSKGVTFLNVLHPDVEYIVDLNPRKQGMFVPGTGQQIVAPEFLRNYKPDTVIIMNPIYRNEIGENLRQMGLAAASIVA